MKLTIIIPTQTEINAPFDFPIYRSRLQGEYNFAGFKKEYWKFESKHKVTKITEEMCQTTILTYDDENADFVKDMMSADMLYGHNFPGAREMHKPDNMTDEQCYSLYASSHDYEYTGEDDKQYQGRYWTEMWQPSKEDIEAINAGRPIILQIHSVGLPPVCLFTCDEKGEPNND